MPIAIDDAVAQIPEWRDRTIEIEPLGGGLTNSNFLVRVDGAPHFVRIPGESTELLAIDRENEIHNSRAAAEAGVAPRLLHVIPGANVMVFEFIRGETMSPASLQAPGMPSRIARSMKRLHAGRPFLKNFDMFRLVEFYLQMAGTHGVPIYPDYRDHLPTVGRIEQAMRRHLLPTVPCHNDLLGENMIDDGRQLWLIDFEYSGNNDPCFELGNTCQELQYNDEQYAELCAAYFGQATASRLARMRLYALMSDVGWTLWGAIQSKISKLDIDFWDYGLTRWRRALGILNSPDLERWIGEA